MRLAKKNVGGTIATAVLAGGFALNAAKAPAATDFGPIIPEDVLFATWVADFPTLKEAFSSSPYGRFWNDPDVEPLRGWFEEQFGGFLETVEEEAQLDLNELVGTLTGGFAVYVNAPEGGFQEGSEPEPVILVELDEEGKEVWSGLLTQIPERLEWEDVRRDSEDVSGVTVYRLSGIDTAAGGVERHAVYTFTDEHLILTYASDEAEMRRVLDRVQSPRAEGSITAREEIRRLGPEAISAPNRYSFYLDLGYLITTAVTGPWADPQTIRIVEGSGLADFQGLIVTGTAGEDLVDSDFLLLTTPQRRGIHEALAAAGNTPMDLVQSVSRDATSVTSFSLDVGKLYSAIMALVNEVEPGAGAMVEMMVLGQFGSYGIDLVNDLLNNIRGEHVVVTRTLDPEIAAQLPQDMALLQSSQAMFFGLANGDEVVTALKRLLENASQDPNYGAFFTYREEDGVVFVESAMPMGDSPMQPQLAFNNQAIVYTNNAIEMQEAVRTLKGETASPLSQDTGFQAAAAEAAGNNTHVFTYTPQSSLSNTVDQLRGILLTGLVDEFLPGFDPAMVPEAGVFERYFGDSFGSVTFEDRMIRFHSALRSAE